MKVKDAKGTTGVIIWDGEEHCFRVYDTNYNFIDYQILHHDLQVTITDGTASFYVGEDREQGYLDYAPRI